MVRVAFTNPKPIEMEEMMITCDSIDTLNRAVKWAHSEGWQIKDILAYSGHPNRRDVTFEKPKPAAK
jgi:hypothetical protein